jgi:hypothetical protein
MDMYNVNDRHLVVISDKTDIENSYKYNRLLFFINSKSLKFIYLKNALKRILIDFCWDGEKKHEA